MLVKSSFKDIFETRPKIRVRTWKEWATLAGAESTFPNLTLAAIGPSDLVDKVAAALEHLNDVRLLKRPYSSEDETLDAYREVSNIADIVLFTGPIPYYRVEQAMGFARPAVYVSLQGTALYRTLFLAKEKCDIERVSIDTFDESVIGEVYGELEVKRSDVAVMEYCGQVTRDRLVKFHESMFASGKTVAALTCLRSAYDELVRRGVPSYWVTPTQASIRDAIERACLLGDSEKSKSSQIAVGFVNIDAFRRFAENAESEHKVNQLLVDVQRILLGYVETIDGCLDFLGQDEYIFFTTRGLLSNRTRGFTYMEVPKLLRERFGLGVSVGLGLGYTANQAGTNARMALRRAKDSGGGACFLVTEDRRLLGPLSSESEDASASPKEEPLRLIDPEMLDRARESGLSISAIRRLMEIVSAAQLSTFVPKDVAPMLGVTVRSVNRMFKKMAEVGLVAAVGEEKTSKRGRSTMVYAFRTGLRGEQ